MKILWITNIPSPYRVDFFNELGKYCELTVIFEKKTSDERDDSWLRYETKHFNAVFLSGKSVGVAEAFCVGIVKYLHKNRYDHIVVTNFSDPTGMLAVTALKAKKIPYIIESDGGFAGTGQGIKEKIKKWLLSNASLYFSTAKEHDNYYMTYGAKKEEIVRYPFTSLHNRDILSEPISMETKLLIRKKLGMREEKIILAVGQFIYRKGYDILIEAVSTMSNVGCYIIGGTPSDEYTNLIHKFNARNVHFVDFKCKPELDEYYMAADLFVHPTREDIWGLVINEAMAKGLPVVTTDRCVAGLELIENSNIGSIVPIDNAVELKNAIENQLASSNYETKKEILEKVRNYTIESMAKQHIRTFEEMTCDKK